MTALKFLLLAAISVSPLCAQDGFALRDGDRVVFYGDSITDQRRYTLFTETYAVTRFPKRNITFVHSGWGGDRVSGGGGGPVDVRLWRDVLPYNPTVVTIMLGMNDGRYRAFDQKIFDEYASGYRHIVEVLKRQLPGVRITAIQPSAYDDVTRPPMFEGGYNKVLLRYSDFLKELATEQKLGLADLNNTLVDALTKAKGIDSALAARLVQDRVHPGEQATLVMAQALLKSWNAPAIVSDVEITAGSKAPGRALNASVSDIASDGMSWTQLDEALPMPLNAQDPQVALVLKSTDFVEALNRQLLTVKGLKGSAYKLLIDDELVGSFSSSQLAGGINLAMLSTPMARQAEAVHQLTSKRTAVHNARWRQLQVPLQLNGSPELLGALKALDELEARLHREQRETAQPKLHRFRLVQE